MFMSDVNMESFLLGCGAGFALAGLLVVGGIVGLLKWDDWQRAKLRRHLEGPSTSRATRAAVKR